jgi:hypothetical protein
MRCNRKSDNEAWTRSYPVTLPLKISNYYLTDLNLAHHQCAVTGSLTMKHRIDHIPLHCSWNFISLSDKVIQHSRYFYYIAIDNFQWFCMRDAFIALRLKISNYSVVSTHPLHYHGKFTNIQHPRCIHFTIIENFNSFSSLDAFIALRLKISTYELTKSFSILDAFMILSLKISNNSVVSTHLLHYDWKFPIIIWQSHSASSTHSLHYHWKFPIIQQSRSIYYITIDNFQLSSDKVIQHPRRIHCITIENFQSFSSLEAFITLPLIISNDWVVSTHSFHYHWQFPMIQ